MAKKKEDGFFSNQNIPFQKRVDMEFELLLGRRTKDSVVRSQDGARVLKIHRGNVSSVKPYQCLGEDYDD